jgi:glycyl-tRNA synthetase alpha subunit
MKKPWFATFTLLDASGAISSSQWQRLVAAVAQLWRRIVRRRI